ncbi:MAG TPA: hypothetical protein VH761_00855 [Ilumatobacteraceae bacterium]|jgi:hypothetical protein
MTLRPIVLAALLMSLSACEVAARATPAATGDTAVPTVAASPLDPAVQCVSTDPGWRPISVHRAVSCPDGTKVTVQGILIHDANGLAVLCDVASASRDRCIGAGVTVEGFAPEPVLASSVDKVMLTGVVSGHVLRAVSRPSAPLRSV